MCNLDFFRTLEGAYAPNTIKAYKADFTHYQRWCQKYNHEPKNKCATVLVWYQNEISQELTSATIKRHIASPSHIFKLTSLPNITKEPKICVFKFDDIKKLLNGKLPPALTKIKNRSVW